MNEKDRLDAREILLAFLDWQEQGGSLVEAAVGKPLSNELYVQLFLLAYEKERQVSDDHTTR